MPDPRRDGTSRLMLFFAIVYAVEGFCQGKVGVIWQPLTHYLKTDLGWDTVQIAASLAILDIPWIIKPLFGIMSDFLPLFGYRRRSYLLLSNAGTVVVLLWATQALAPAPLIVALTLVSVGMAVASTVCGALLVENGQRYDASAAFINQQWLWFNVAVMAATLLGGMLIEWLPPAGALQAALALAAAAPLAVVFTSVTLVDEARAGIRREELRLAMHAFLATFRQRTLWLIAAFLFLYYFSPGFGTPLYFYLTDELRFSQGTIGLLSSCNAGGWIAGGLLYHYALRGLTTRALLNLSIVAGTLTTLGYLGIVDEVTAIIVYFLYGVAGMIASIATLAIAASVCPPRSEGFAFAALMSVINLATSLHDTIGSLLYEYAFRQQLAPLIVVSAASTGVILVLVPFLERRRMV